MRGNITAEELEKLNLETMTAPCKFCRQYVQFKWNAETPITEDEKIEEATLNCSCESARWYQERDTKINTAREKINELFGVPEEGGMRKVLLEAVEQVVNKSVIKISMIAENGAKGEISITQKDAIKIRRTEATVTEASI